MSVTDRLLVDPHCARAVRCRELTCRPRFRANAISTLKRGRSMNGVVWVGSASLFDQVVARVTRHSLVAATDKWQVACGCCCMSESNVLQTALLFCACAMCFSIALQLACLRAQSNCKSLSRLPQQLAVCDRPTVACVRCKSNIGSRVNMRTTWEFSGTTAARKTKGENSAENLKLFHNRYMPVHVSHGEC